MTNSFNRSLYLAYMKDATSAIIPNTINVIIRASGLDDTSTCKNIFAAVMKKKISPNNRIMRIRFANPIANSSIAYIAQKIEIAVSLELLSASTRL